MTEDLQPNPAPGLIAAGASLEEIREAAEGCRACELYADATMVVFGEGPVPAQVMVIGEQPGNAEDRSGEPFVGPAGGVLDDALEAAGISRDDVYVTNMVKHFRWKPAGKKRLHQKPASRHIKACRPWLEAELARVAPRVVVCLGATAAQALFGSRFRVTTEGGIVLEWEGFDVVATIHPSAVLRAPDAAARSDMRRTLVDHLAVVAGLLE